MANVPVVSGAGGDDEQQPEAGVGLCLSGGGYRAMVFHVGVLWRLYEANVLRGVSRISSVSGGSITAAVLGRHWMDLPFDGARAREDFVPRVVDPVRKLAGETLDAEAIVLGLALAGTVGQRIAAAYDKHLFNGATLQDLPDSPRFVINATNVQSCVLWRFSKPYMGDYRVGRVLRPKTSLARAVAASSAFPPVLSPVELDVDPDSFSTDPNADLQRVPFTSKIVLTDGGVYDNLGLETVWKRYQTVLVSDGGGHVQPQEEPKADWARHAYRVLDLVDNQVRSLRKRQLIDSYEAKARKGAYWGIRTDIADYGMEDALPCPLERTTELASLPTRLKRMDDRTQERLINWGYAVCDAALRRYVDTAMPPPAFPYPAIGV
jgi:NTE family protein